MKSSVCRCLFGPVDHEQLRRDLQLSLREMSLEDSHSWNFNFHADTPLPGRFAWEESPGDCSSPRPKPISPAGEDEDSPAECKEGKTDREDWPCVSNDCPTEVTPVRRVKTPPVMVVKRRDHGRITDVCVKRRRTTEDRHIDSLTTSTESALCKP
ncbi:cyclin dependent kinase inhibitor 1Ca [Phycodurus eques]|uniref:cyclin dependent kinase inhibitor 1Ca n=1 Tax=Phycodurus eques TaxID=693459 RepID=UPI002ACE8A62|nr:cyclin dependent kinase inhibitor 1Ca [Phycodurus eques]